MEPVQLFEAWKRALDATIEVPDCEPAINALRGGLRKIRRGMEEDVEEGGSWLCLFLKALQGFLISATVWNSLAATSPIHFLEVSDGADFIQILYFIHRRNLGLK